MNREILEIILRVKDQLTPGIKRASRQGSAGLDKITDSAKKMDKGIAATAITWAKFAAAIGAAVIIVRAVTNAINTMVGEAIAAEVAQAKLETTVRGNTDALIAQATALQNLTGIADDVIINSQAMLGTFQLNAQEVAVLTPRLLDMAAALQQAGGAAVDVQAVAIAMGKAVTIGAGALTRYGVVLNDVQREQLETAQGMERINLIAEILDDNFAGLAETVGDTFAGQMNKLNNAWGDFLETLGSFITQSPAVQEAIAGITRQIQTLTANLTADPTGGTDPAEQLRAQLGGMGAPSGLFTREAFEAAANNFVDIPDIVVPDGGAAGGGGGTIEGAITKTKADILRAQQAILDVLAAENIARKDKLQEWIRIQDEAARTLKDKMIVFAEIQDVLNNLAAQREIAQLIDRRRITSAFDPTGAEGLLFQVSGGQKPKKGEGRFGGDFLQNALGAGIGGFAGGGGRGAIQSILPLIGSAFGPIGGAIGGLLGGLLGKKKRGEVRSNPVFVEEVKKGDQALALLNIFKGTGAAGGGRTINDINNLLRGGGATLGFSSAPS